MSQVPDKPDSDVLRVLIVDDEPLARRRLRKLLTREPDVEIIGEAASGSTAIEMIQTANREDMPIDIVFLDVQMPGNTGLDVVRKVGPDAMPVTIFVTAYDQHALAAFELTALDYLLKPFENDRFEHALRRARENIRLKNVDQLRNYLLVLLQGNPSRLQAKPRTDASRSPKYLERIAVEMKGQIRVVPVKDIDYFTAEDHYIRLHAGNKTFLITDTLGGIEAQLDPDRFSRIHRSIIVQLDRVEALHTAPGGYYAVRLRDGPRLRVARGRKDLLAEKLGLERK